jgi:5-hydroxyisourate hydrolase-like protein (transthyretin family)
MSFFGILWVLLQVQLASAGGVVTKPGGNEPLGGATVVLSSANPLETARTKSAVTEDDGRFSIRDIEPGEYRLQVQSARYGNASYGQRKPDGPGSILSITPGQSVSDLRLSIPSTGAIAGRITGQNGEPLVHAAVQALKYVYEDGNRILALMQSTTTDDRGQYRLFWLSGGKYIVAATARTTPQLPQETGRPVRPGETIRSNASDLALNLALASGAVIMSYLENTTAKRILEDGSVQEESWMPVYYPATNDPALASSVEVREGATTTGIDLVLGPSKVQKVRGRVAGFTPGSQATVNLVRAETGVLGRSLGKGASTIDGAFEFAGVAPGAYYLTARDRNGLTGIPMPLLVGDRDIDNLTVGLSAGVTLSGRITLEGVTQNSNGPDPLGGLTVALRPDVSGMILASVGGQPRTGTTLNWTNVPPGDYQLTISQGVLQPGQKRLYIKSILLGRTDVTGVIPLSSATNERLEVVLTTEVGSIEGVASNATGRPAANATIVLVPTNARRRASLYKSVVTGTNGRFRFQEVPPGDYKVFAWDDVETGAWQNAEFIRQYESKGSPVRIAGTGKEDVQVNVIYNP